MSCSFAQDASLRFSRGICWVLRLLGRTVSCHYRVGQIRMHPFPLPSNNNGDDPFFFFFFLLNIYTTWGRLNGHDAAGCDLPSPTCRRSADPLPVGMSKRDVRMDPSPLAFRLPNPPTEQCAPEDCGRGGPISIHSLEKWVWMGGWEGMKPK